MQSNFPNERITEIYRQMEHYHSLAQWSACPVQRWRYETLMMEEIRRFMDVNRKEQQAMRQAFLMSMEANRSAPSADSPAPSADLPVEG